MSGRLFKGDGIVVCPWATTLWIGGKATPEQGPVTIGSQCCIGPNVIISSGVNIGNGCVIGANALVNKNIPNGICAWGSPAKCQGKARCPEEN